MPLEVLHSGPPNSQNSSVKIKKNVEERKEAKQKTNQTEKRMQQMNINSILV